MAVVDFEPFPAPDGPAELVVFQKFRSIIRGQAAKMKREIWLLLQSVKDRPHRGGLSIWQQEDLLPQGSALGEGEEDRPAPSLAYHQVHLLVAVFLPLSDDLRSPVDGRQLRVR